MVGVGGAAVAVLCDAGVRVFQLCFRAGDVVGGDTTGAIHED